MVDNPDTPQTRRSTSERFRKARSWAWSTWTDEAPLIYRRSATGKHRARVLWVELFLFCREVIRNFINSDLSARAASLAFTTLLSLIPLTVALSRMLRVYFEKIFPDLSSQTDTFLNVIMPYQSSQIAYHLNEFAKNASAVSAWGTIAFLVVSFRLFMAVEMTINRIWNAHAVRGYRQKIIAFTMLFFWGPILIGLSFTTSNTMERNPVLRAVTQNSLVLNLVPVIVLFIAFTMLFWLVPATKVRLKSAALGALVTTMLFELVRYGFGFYAQYLFKGKLNFIYGTLGLLVIFLLALEAMWVVILIGVQISFVYQNFQGILRASEKQLAEDPRYDLYFGVRALVEIARRFEKREEAPSSYRLAEEFGATDKQMLAVLRKLEDVQLVKEIGGDWAGFVPGCDASRITVEEVIRQIEGHRRDIPDSESDLIGKTALGRIFRTLDASMTASLSETTIGDLVNELSAPPPRPQLMK
ncbi:MAG TPA: YihY family inner membrane protein [Thermoanaerobaculia bacterium]|nr:YihY family inner membrane protein [Thermoanaerobaculia bacterium]